MNRPKPILVGNFISKDEATITTLAATEFWLCNEGGNSFYLRWWGNGWVVQVQESFLCKNDKLFKHKSDIVGFDHSRYGGGWRHVFDTKEEAVECYRTMSFPELVKSEEFYHKVYDILVLYGGASDDDGEYRKAFIYNFVKDKIKDDEWRFQGKLGFGGKYWSEHNAVNCYPEDETPERLALIEKINEELKKIEK